MIPKKRLNILLADDGSRHAQSAVELLQSLPLPTTSRIVVVRGFTSGQIPYLPEYEKALKRTKTQLESSGFKATTILEMGPPAEKILEIAAAKKSDLIVVGAKGLRATLGILLGEARDALTDAAAQLVAGLDAFQDLPGLGRRQGRERQDQQRSKERNPFDSHAAPPR